MTASDRSFNKSRKILVAGGAGFIGSHLCSLLLGQGHHVTCLDNLVTGQTWNIDELRSAVNFDFVEGDVCESVISLGRFDEIYNFACPASPAAYQANPIRTLKTSVLGALNVLELARTHDATILHASTSEIYGDPRSHPQKETDWGNVNPIGPRACYDEGKRCAETLFFDYHRVHGVRIKIARIFNTYGPRMSVADGRVVSNFIVQSLRNQSITIYGDGRQTRSFCYVDDLITGLARFMIAPDRVTGPINLGNPEEFTISELADIVIRELHWTPKVRLEQGLVRTIAYFEDRLRRQPPLSANVAAAPAD
jgi:UDP-glucuronate decarboxylase